MQIKFSEDVVPLSDLKVNPGKIVNRANDNKRPILVTSRGRGVAVVQGLEEYEVLEEKVAYLRVDDHFDLKAARAVLGSAS